MYVSDKFTEFVFTTFCLAIIKKLTEKLEGQPKGSR